MLSILLFCCCNIVFKIFWSEKQKLHSKIISHMDNVLRKIRAVLVNTIFLDFLELRLFWDLINVVLTTLFFAPRAPTITGTDTSFEFHILQNSISNSLYLLSLSNSFTAMFWSVGILISIRRQVLSLMSFTSLVVCKGNSQMIVKLSPSTTGCGRCSNQLVGVDNW